MSTTEIYFWVHGKKVESLGYAHHQKILRSDLFKVAEEIVNKGFNVMITNNGEILHVDDKSFNQR